MIPEGFKPLLAINQDKVKKQPTTCYASEKLDGIRVIFFGGVAYSRTLKSLPNKLLQKLAQDYAYILEGCDGEVIAGDLYAKNVLQQSNSFCMKADNTADFKVYLFDRYIPNTPWINRYLSLTKLKLPDNVVILEHYLVRNEYRTNQEVPCIDLEQFEQEVLAKGGEGVMLRNPNAEYKFGRSGKINPQLQKVKRFIDDEFLVVGYKQFESNQNEATTDELGHTKRSTCKEGKVLQDKLGSLILVTFHGIEFSSGSGFTEEQRLTFWGERDSLVGRYAKVQFFYYTEDGVPYLPVWKDFRDSSDM